MSYSIAPGDLDMITDLDLSFGTIKLLPKMEDIPDDFEEEGSDAIYFKVVHSLFYGFPLPAADANFKEGFDPEKVLRAVRAHLASFDPAHEHKMSGTAYMLKCMCTITPIDQSES